MENGNSSRNRLTLAEVSACKAEFEAILDTGYEDSAVGISTLIEETNSV